MLLDYCESYEILNVSGLQRDYFRQRRCRRRSAPAELNLRLVNNSVMFFTPWQGFADKVSNYEVVKLWLEGCGVYWDISRKTGS